MTYQSAACATEGLYTEPPYLQVPPPEQVLAAGAARQPLRLAPNEDVCPARLARLQVCGPIPYGHKRPKIVLGLHRPCLTLAACSQRPCSCRLSDLGTP